MLEALLIVILWLVGVTIASTDDCRLWLAPSYTSTDKVTKYGIFAGVSYRENESLPMAEIAIPLIDMFGSFNRRTTRKDKILDFLESYLWTSDYAGTKWEASFSSSVPVLIPGIGILPQYHSEISNVDYFQEGVLLRTRSKIPESGQPHPSRGSITPYSNVTIRATRNIPAGMGKFQKSPQRLVLLSSIPPKRKPYAGSSDPQISLFFIYSFFLPELFANFGDEWDESSTNSKVGQEHTLSRHDYDMADKIIHQFVNLYNDFPSLSIDAKGDIMDFMLRTVLDRATKKHAKIIRSIIPENPRRLQAVIDAGGSFLYRYSDMIHSTEWFSKNGYCLDSLRIGPSSIPNAGRGAFAHREFVEGDIISLSPMIHIADSDLLDMYKLGYVVDSKTGEMSLDYLTDEDPVGQQLLLNYCFGHPESSLLLFPMASHVGLINHQKEPNAYITWSRVRDNGLSNQHSYQDRPVTEMAEVDKIVVVMKVVALRKIEEGEEVTISYGDDWQKAWDVYMDRWQSSKAKRPHRFTAEDLRELYKNKPFHTTETIPSDPYPENIISVCFLNTKERPDGQPKLEGRVEIVDFTLPSDGTLYEGSRMIQVDILEQYETGDDHFFNYTVMAYFPSSGRKNKVLQVPHSACTFVDRPYTSDIHIRGAFRHYIGISDNDFPQAWRDLR